MTGLLTVNARKLYDAGFWVLAIKGKRPMRSAWQKARQDWTSLEADLAHATGIGIVTGVASGVVVIDIDPRNGPDAWLEANRLLLANAPCEITGSGGRHYFFRHPGGYVASKTGKVGLAPGVELKADGGHQVVVAPSIHPNGLPYQWQSDMPLWKVATGGPILPPELTTPSAAPPERTRRVKEEYEDLPEDIEMCRTALADLAPGVQGAGGDNQTFRAACLGRDYSLSPEVFLPLLFEWNERCQPPWSDADLQQKVKSAYRNSRAQEPGQATARGLGFEPSQESTGAPKDAPPVPAEPAKADNRSVTVDWQREILRGRDGWKSHARNVELVLTHDERVSGCVRYNLLTNGIEIVRAPWRKWVGDTEWSEEDSVAFTQWAARAFDDRPALNRDAVEQAIVPYARQFSYHPVRDYLTSLVWDGVPRLAHWLATYIGADAGQYASAVGLRYLIGAVRRVMAPGCKFDSMLVIEGPQGAYKSTSLRVLFGDNWFTDSDAEIGTKDANDALRGKWCWEIGELAGMSKADVTTIKGFLSRRVDRYRPAYARYTRDFPRQIVIAGTTNDDEYLKDITGARRFWPVRCGRIDIDALTRDRDQLWAEAYARFMQGVPSWLDQGESLLLAAETDNRYVEDAWMERIARWLETPDEFDDGKKRRARVTTLEVYVALGGKAEHCDRRVQMRMADVMRRLNWQRVRRDGQGWGFERPADLPTLSDSVR